MRLSSFGKTLRTKLERLWKELWERKTRFNKRCHQPLASSTFGLQPPKLQRPCHSYPDPTTTATNDIQRKRTVGQRATLSLPLTSQLANSGTPHHLIDAAQLYAKLQKTVDIFDISENGRYHKILGHPLSKKNKENHSKIQRKPKNIQNQVLSSHPAHNCSYCHRRPLVPISAPSGHSRCGCSP